MYIDRDEPVQIGELIQKVRPYKLVQQSNGHFGLLTNRGLASVLTKLLNVQANEGLAK